VKLSRELIDGIETTQTSWSARSQYRQRPLGCDFGLHGRLSL